MTTPGIDHSTVREWLTITELVQFARCPRKFFLSTACGLRPLDTALPLKYGEAIHCAYPWALRKDLDKAVAEFSRVWDPSGLEDLQDKKRNKAVATDLLSSLSCSNLPFEILEPPPTLPVRGLASPFEVPFVIDIGLPIPLMGSIDGLVRLRATGDPWALEIKTTSELADRFFFSFERNCQIIGYCFAMRETFRSLPQGHPLHRDIPGTIVHGLFISDKNQRNQANLVTVTDLQVQQFLTFVQDIGNRILECERTKSWPQYISGCNQIGMFGLPGYNCEFTAPCQLPDWTLMKDSFRYEPHVPFTLEEKSPQ